MTNVIEASDFWEWARSALSLEGHHVKRIIIDSMVGDTVKVYLEEYGTTKMLEVVPPTFSPAQIYIVNSPESTIDIGDLFWVQTFNGKKLQWTQVMVTNINNGLYACQAEESGDYYAFSEAYLRYWEKERHNVVS